MSWSLASKSTLKVENTPVMFQRCISGVTKEIQHIFFGVSIMSESYEELKIPFINVYLFNFFEINFQLLFNSSLRAPKLKTCPK